jgi:hypothetical protein
VAWPCKEKTELLSGIRERGFATLAHRFAEVVSREATGIDQMIAIGRAYVAFSQEFPARFEARTRIIGPQVVEQALSMARRSMQGAQPNTSAEDPAGST